MNHRTYPKWLAVLAAGLVQVAGAAQLEEVVVTATKRGAIDVQSLAESIHAISGNDLAFKRQFEFQDFAGSVPGLQFQDLGPGDKEYIIRGINGNGPSVVGAYFDEYVITARDEQDGGGKNAPIKLVDIERVEVLNGPQGTLYGANSMAGNIRFISRKPDATAFDATGDVDFSDTKEGGQNYLVSGVLNIPVIQDVLALRLVGYYEDADGVIDQVRGERTVGGVRSFDRVDKDIDAAETTGGRFSLRWTPNDALTVDLMYVVQDLEVDGSPRFTGKGVPAWPGQPPAIAALPGNPGFAPIPGLAVITPDEDFVNTDITNNPRDDTVELFGTTVEYDAPFGTFSVAAARYDHDIIFRFDSTPILLAFDNLFGLGGFINVPAITRQPQSYETTMVEARFASAFEGPINFVGGVYFQRDENDFAVQVLTTDGNGNPAGAFNPANANDAFLSGGTAVFGRFRRDEIEQAALFGEATWQFMEQWELLAGFRWFGSSLESVQATTHGFFPAGPTTVAGTQVGTTVNGNAVGLIEQSDDTIRPKVSLSYQWTEDRLLYVLYSEGFRTGGINNGNQPFAAGIPATFESDELQNLEFGIKSRWLAGRLQANATVFLIDWDNIQVEPRDPLGNIPFTTNGGAAEINGIEWAIEALLTEQLTASFTGTYFFDHELSEDQPVLPGASPFVIVGRDGDEIPNTPDFQLYGSLRWDTQVWGWPSSFLIDVTYRDETNSEFVPTSPFNISLDSYTLVNLFANVQINDHFTVGIYGKNLSDDLAATDGIGTFQDPQSLVAVRPRTFGFNVRWTY